jgi:hypothetical protein
MARSGPVTKDTSTIALGLAQIRVGNSATNIATVTSVLPSAASIGALASTKYTGTVDYWRLMSGFPQLEDMSIPLRETSMLECEFKEITPYNLALARGIDPSGGQAASATFLSLVSAAGTKDLNKSIAVTQNAGPVTDTWTVAFTSGTAFTVYGSATGSVGSGTKSVAFAPDHSGQPYFTIPADFFTGTNLAGDTATFRTVQYMAAGAYDNNHSGAINLGALSAPAFVRMEAVYTYPNGTNHMYIIFPRANATASTELDLQAEDSAASPLTFEAKRADSETSGGHSAWDSAPLGRIYFD